jgi:hypothetical protein
MSYINPIWLEGQRKRWTRHDAHRFAPPAPPKSFAARRIEQRRADEEQAAAAAEQDAFEREVLALRRELASIGLDYELRRFQRKYSPNQPRVPAGSREGGQWTSGGGTGRNDPRVISDATPDNNAIPGAQYAQGRARGPVTVRIGGRTFEIEGGQAARLVEAQTRADDAIARVRELDPNWRPTPSFKESVEGSIRAYEAEAREAQARASELAKVGIGPGPFAGESIPARGPERNFTAAERREINRIGSETGCHTCATRDPETTSGNFVVDHQPPSALNSLGRSQQLYPQCLTCSLRQGGWITGRRIGR